MATLKSSDNPKQEVFCFGTHELDEFQYLPDWRLGLNSETEKGVCIRISIVTLTIG